MEMFASINRVGQWNKELVGSVPVVPSGLGALLEESPQEGTAGAEPINRVVQI
jgi:hypothetical protein